MGDCFVFCFGPEVHTMYVLTDFSVVTGFMSSFDHYRYHERSASCAKYCARKNNKCLIYFETIHGFCVCLDVCVCVCVCVRVCFYFFLFFFSNSKLQYTA